MLVAFSCRARAVYPSCLGRRMSESAINLVGHVLPDVPVRQFAKGAWSDRGGLLVHQSRARTRRTAQHAHVDAGYELSRGKRAACVRSVM